MAEDFDSFLLLSGVLTSRSVAIIQLYPSYSMQPQVGSMQLQVPFVSINILIYP